MCMFVACLRKLLCSSLRARARVLGMKKSARLVSAVANVSDAALSRIIGRIKEDPSLLSVASSAKSINRQALAAAHEVGIVEHTLALSKGPALVWQVLVLQDLLPVPMLPRLQIACGFVRRARR